MPVQIADSILRKLAGKTPPVTRREVEQCFENRAGGLLRDTREQNRTNPPTLWFIAKTNQNRELKVVFIRVGQDLVVKTAYDPNPEELRIYTKFA